MSDERLERLNATRRALLVNSIFFGVGWLMIMVGMGWRYANYLSHSAKALQFIGWGIMGGPKMWAAMLGGFGAALKPDYQVITTYGDGRKESDGGTQSIQMNFLGRLIVIAILYVIGGVLTIITGIYLTIKYIVLHIATSPKPAFIKSGLFIIVMNLAVLVGGALIMVVIQQTGEAVQRAERGEKKSGDFRFINNEAKDGLIVDSYLSNKGGDIVIPATSDGLPVVGLLDRGGVSELGTKGWGPNDKRTERITSVVIPDTVAFIEHGFFKDCKDLKKITLPKNLKYMSGSFEGSGLTSIVIPEGVTDIGNNTFKDCANLTSVTLPRSLERIGSNAFENCTSLVEIKIPSGSRIKYGYYSSGGDYGKNILGIAAFTNFNYFTADEDYTGTADIYYKKAFKGCTKLSYDTRNVIRDSGYTGEF
jgi:hypothetical protein